MVIQHYHRLTAFQKLRTLRDAGLTDIHHHQYRIIAYHLQCLRIIDDHILFIFIVISKHIHHGLHGAADIVQDDMRRLVQRPGNPVDTYGSAEAVRVSHPVSHNIHFILDGDDLPKRMCLDSRLDTRALLHLLALAAVICNILRHLDYSLVSAPSQRNINGIARKLVIL